MVIGIIKIMANGNSKLKIRANGNSKLKMRANGNLVDYKIGKILSGSSEFR